MDAWHFALPDGLGSVRHVLDENLNTVYSADYAAYGDVIASEGMNPMAYGLAYHRARYYGSESGRVEQPRPPRIDESLWLCGRESDFRCCWRTCN